MKKTFFIYLTILPHLLLSQTTHQLTLKPNTTYNLQFAKAFQSLSVVYGAKQSLTGSKITANKREFSLQSHTHNDANTQQFSQLLVFNKPLNEFQLKSGKLSGPITIHLYHLGDTRAIQQRVKAYQSKFRTTQTCGKPVSIPQSIWRAGLAPAPIPDPVVTEVKHLIIHHSVTSNAVVDQVAIVRAIYLFHRVTRGWNDIAYNYLIAPDGTLFEGRDPQGKETEGDNIRGGHFCTGRQDGTMGVCLLGTFVDYEPPLPMLKTLIQLLDWKVQKDGMDPFGTFPHPFSLPVVNALPVIAGHQHGCTTQCPGNKVFEKIADIREKVHADVQVCAGKTDHCAPLRITGSIYTAVNQLQMDFETALNNCQNSGTNCDLFCSGQSFLEQVTSLRNQIQTIEQTCQNDAQNCIQPCNSASLLNQLTALEQQFTQQIQFWLNSSSAINDQVTALETQINNALTFCVTNLDSCSQFYPINTFAENILNLQNEVDSLQNICQAVPNAPTTNADILRSKLGRLVTKIAQHRAELEQQNQLVVYPNPTNNGVVWVRSLQISQINQFRLRNILGKSFAIQQVIQSSSPYQWQLVLPRLPSGWYLLEMQINDRWERRRLLLR